MLPELKEIREKRKRLGISQRRLARQVGVSQSNIAKIESGKLSPPYSVVKKIFTFLESVQSNSAGKVSEIASSPVFAIATSDTVQRAVEMFRSTGFKQLPVKDNDLWSGCVYERTIARLVMGADDPKTILRRRVGSIMDEALPTVTEETPLPTVIPLLQQAQALLVTKQGRVTGIVTNADLLKIIRPDSGPFIVAAAKRRRVPR